MRKHFLTSASKVGGTRIITQLLTILKHRDCSQSFPAQISNQILKQVVRDGEDCHKSRRAYGRDIPRFSFLPSIPQYQHKIWRLNKLTHDNPSIEKRGCDKNNGLLHFSKSDIIISTKFPDVIKVRVVPATALYFVEVANQTPVTLVDLNSHLIAGIIDLGSDRLVFLASNKPTFTPTIYDKKHLKSINQGFNQRRAFLRSKLDRAKYTTRQIQQITFNRNQRLENYLHQTSTLIVKGLVDEKIIQLIIGKNVKNKLNIKLEKKHQTFLIIPQPPLIKFITYKTALVGIKVIVTEASYTNKCRFWDLEPVGKQESYQGKRGKRGWFRYLNESRINAEVNAALNMIVKVNVNSLSEECHNRIYMLAISPVRVAPVRKEPQKVR